MTSVTVRLPDETYRRLDEMAREQGTSVDQLFDDMAARMVAETDAETRFCARVMRGQGQAARGLELLRKAAENGAAE